MAVDLTDYAAPHISYSPTAAHELAGNKRNEMPYIRDIRKPELQCRVYLCIRDTKKELISKQWGIMFPMLKV